MKLTTIACILGISFGTNMAVGADPIVSTHESPNAIPFAVFKLSGLVNPDGLEGSEGMLGSGVTPNQSEFDFYGGFACNGLPSVGSWNDSNHVVLRYCGTTGSLNARVDASPSYCMDANIGIPPVLNYLQIELVNRTDVTSFRYENVTLILQGRRIPLGSFEASGWNTWNVQGLDLAGGFSLEGDLILRWASNPPQIGQESGKIIIKLGALPGIATAASGHECESSSSANSFVAQR